MAKKSVAKPDDEKASVKEISSPKVPPMWVEKAVGRLAALIGENRKFSRAEIAPVMGRDSEKSVGKFLRGDQVPDVDKVVSLARHTGVSLDRLFDLEPTDSDEDVLTQAHYHLDVLATSEVDLSPTEQHIIDLIRKSEADPADVYAWLSKALNGPDDSPKSDSPRVLGNEKLEPVKRLKSGKAGDEVGAGRPLGEYQEPETSD